MPRVVASIFVSFTCESLYVIKYRNRVDEWAKCGWMLSGMTRLELKSNQLTCHIYIIKYLTTTDLKVESFFLIFYITQRKYNLNEIDEEKTIVNEKQGNKILRCKL